MVTKEYLRNATRTQLLKYLKKWGKVPPAETSVAEIRRMAYEIFADTRN